MISFRVALHEAEVIHDIALRAVSLARRHRIPYDIQTASMDITATHANGTPLRLNDLKDFPDFDFAHDVFGIRRHLDRTTGRLMDHFVPRSASQEQARPRHI